jgi:integrase
LILRLARKQQEYYSGGIISGSEYVFRSKKDVLNVVVRKPREAERVFHALIDSFGGCPERFRLHDLRHTYISICLNGGVNYLKTAASAGHVIGSGNGNTTTKTYWHDDGSRDVINTFIAGAVPVEIDETTVFDGFFNENGEAGNGTEG